MVNYWKIYYSAYFFFTLRNCNKGGEKKYYFRLGSIMANLPVLHWIDRPVFWEHTIKKVGSMQITLSYTFSLCILSGKFLSTCIQLFSWHRWLRASCDAHNKLGMEGFPLALVAENTPMLELLVGGNLECTWKFVKSRIFFILAITILSLFACSICDEKVRIIFKSLYILQH